MIMQSHVYMEHIRRLLIRDEYGRYFVVTKNRQPLAHVSALRRHERHEK